MRTVHVSCFAAKTAASSTAGWLMWRFSIGTFTIIPPPSQDPHASAGEELQRRGCGLCGNEGFFQAGRLRAAQSVARHEIGADSR